MRNDKPKLVELSPGDVLDVDRFLQSRTPVPGIWISVNPCQHRILADLIEIEVERFH